MTRFSPSISLTCPDIWSIPWHFEGSRQVITLYTMRPILYPPPQKKKTTIADICPHNLTVTLPWPYRLYNCTYLLVYSSIGTRESSIVTRSAFDNDQRNVTAFRPISEAAHSWSYDKHNYTTRKYETTNKLKCKLILKFGDLL